VCDVFQYKLNVDSFQQPVLSDNSLFVVFFIIASLRTNHHGYPFQGFRHISSRRLSGDKVLPAGGAWTIEFVCYFLTPTLSVYNWRLLNAFVATYANNNICATPRKEITIIFTSALLEEL